jgi:hypothetical protein
LQLQAAQLQPQAAQQLQSLQPQALL